MQQYQCPRCGAQVAFGVRFCGNCQTPLNWPTQQQQPPQYQQPPPQYQQQYQQPGGGYQQQPEPPKKKTNKLGIILLVLGIILLASVGSCVVCVMLPSSSESPPSPTTTPTVTPKPTPSPTPTPAPTPTPPQLISKDVSEMVLVVADFEPGWVLDSSEPATKEGAQSVCDVYFYEGSMLPYPSVVQNTVAVYPSIEQAQQAYLSEVPKNVSLENPKIGDESFLDISIPVSKCLVFRKSNVVVWVWLQQDMFGDVKPYAKIIEGKIR